MKKTALLLVLVMIFAPSTSYANDIVIKEGTEVLIKVIERLKSGEVAEGSVVRFLVDKAVKDGNGFVLIEDGARAYGTVIKSKKAGMFGTSGALEISIDRVEAFNGKDVSLRASMKDEGTSSTGAVVAGMLFVSVLSFLFRGDNAVVPSGTIFTTYVDKTTVLSEQSPQPTPQALTADHSPYDSVSRYLGIVTSTEKTKEGGFTILEIVPRGLAEFAGIQKGDVLTKIDTYNLKEHDIERVSSYVDMRIKQKAIIKATVLRGKNTKVIDMQL